VWMVAFAVGIAVIRPFFHAAPDNKLEEFHSAHSETAPRARRGRLRG
jgi:hypothetical protein